MEDNRLRAYLSEMIGTFALVLISAGAVVVSRMPGGLTPVSVSIALAAGLIYAGALAVVLPVSKGYLNPALTIMLWVFKKMDGVQATALVLVQFLGSALAGFAVRFILSIGSDDVVQATRLGAPHLNFEAIGAAGVTLGPILKGVGVELLLTFILAFVLYGLAFDPRAPRGVTRLLAVWLGIVLAAVTIVGAPITGAAVNPARWFGPALAETTVPFLSSMRPFQDHAIYWIGPIAGALLGGWVYSALVLPAAEAEERAQAPATLGSAAGSTLFRAKR
jgi:glycerol uptake facilitator-like aquaporin